MENEAPLFRSDGLLSRKPTRLDIENLALMDVRVHHALRMVRNDTLTFEEALMALVIIESEERKQRIEADTRRLMLSNPGPFIFKSKEPAP